MQIRYSMNKTSQIVIVSVISFSLALLSLIYIDPSSKFTSEAPQPPIKPPVIKPEVQPRTTPSLSTDEIKDFLPYSNVVSLMKQWANEAPRLCEFGSYGKTYKGTDCTYLRMGKKGKPKILIHACLHGNERLSAACTLNIMARLLSNYKKRDKETWLLDNRDIYFVPVVSPDTYLKARWVEGVDPNRDFPCPERPHVKSSSPVMRLRELCSKHDFKGAISGHTYGRIYLYPRFKEAYQTASLARQMAELSNYRAGSIGSGYPTRRSGSRGYEIDFEWIFLSAPAVLTEFGNGRPGDHYMPSSMILPETDRVYEAYLLFIRKAPDIKVNVPEEYKKGITE